MLQVQVWASPQVAMMMTLTFRQQLRRQQQLQQLPPPMYEKAPLQVPGQVKTCV